MAGSSAADEDEITGINITPLVDIILVLLIVFMMTASYTVAPAIKVELPRAATAEPVAQASTLSLVITREGTVYLNNAIVDDAQVRAHIRGERAAGHELRAVIAADANVKHGRVVALIDLIQAEGIGSFALNTDADFSGGAAPGAGGG